VFNDGRYGQALNTFGRAAMAAPKAGEPKLGYALAAAMRGDDARAAYAMRRVLRFDRQTLDQPPPISAKILAELIERYEYQNTDDGRLMLKTLRQFQSALPSDAAGTDSDRKQGSAVVSDY